VRIIKRVKRKINNNVDEEEKKSFLMKIKIRLDL
jgi:hypothetical protein